MGAKIVKSTARTIVIFEFFAATRRPATASEIEAALGLPQSSTSALLHSLCELGYLEYLPAGRLYQPTMQLVGLGEWFANQSPGALLSNRIDELRNVTQETVAIARLLPWQVHYVDIAVSENRMVYYLRRGSRSPACTTASGRALLSTLSDAEIVRRVHRHNVEVDPGDTPVRHERVLELIAQIRERGLSETDPDLDGHRDTHAIAALIPRGSAREPLAILVGGPRERVLRRRSDLVEMINEWLAVERSRDGQSQDEL